ncbi:DUF4083 domain-containing protein [Pseudalkalibacillus sp. NRS-1564]|uniref:DUF4083 domain-containing protein n=1 Tax=Pseudalkalibacillus sp. NRS-1564 TaxID=3233900 RepID=UPI003D2A4705
MEDKVKLHCISSKNIEEWSSGSLDNGPSLLIFMMTIILMGITVGSFVLFIRRLLINSKVNHKRTKNVEDKLDRIIELLEEKKR